MSTEVQIMELISTAGESKSKAFEALKKVKVKDFKGAKLLIEEARKIDIEAHRIQTELITQDLNEDVESPAMSLLMVHAQDHYMTSQLAKDLIEALIDCFDN